MGSEQIEVAWRIGDTIENRWEVHRILVGGMGIVYLVYDNEAQQAFAAKTFREDVLVQQPDLAERFRNEARAWIELDRHQNVTRAHFIQNVRGRPLLFLEYVSGGDLGRWIGSPRLTEDPRRVLSFAIQFCDGMIHATGKGINAHRDIKPENCLISDDNVLKVTDFGLAKAFDSVRRIEPRSHAAGDTAVSQTGLGAGTPTHMSPEQFEDVKHADIRSDVYSFGVMLFQMATGKLPFVGSTVQELEYFHKRKAPPRLPHSNDARLDALVQSCLAKKPSDRVQTFGALRQHLAEIYESRFKEAAPKAQHGGRLGVHDLNNKAISLNKLGRNQEALACINRAIQSNERDALSWVNKASILSDMARHNEAIQCCDEALRLDPKEPKAWGNKGVSLAATGRAEEALRSYDMALRFDPMENHTWSNKGLVFASLGKLEDAAACHRRATVLNPLDDLAWSNFGVALRAAGRERPDFR